MAPEDEMTIDELAREAGVTTRNVRAYHTRGLLPPPRIVGRVAYYGDGHVARLRYIARLQSQGFSLTAIGQLLEAWEQGRSLQDVLGFEDAITTPWSDESPQIYSRAHVEELFPEVVHDPRLLDRAAELGLLAYEGDDFKVTDPSLLEVGAELVAAGIPLAAVLDEHEELIAATDRMARRFVKLFETYVWQPFAEAGLPPDQLEQITKTLRRTRPATFIAVRITLMRAMERAVAASTGEQVRELIEEKAPAS